MDDQGFVKLSKVAAYFDETAPTTRRRAKRLGVIIADGKVRAADFEAMKRAADRLFRATTAAEARP